MKLLLLYLLLLKATVTTFSGLASLPVIRDDLAIKRHWITDEQLNTAIVVTRTTPGPVGLYVVSVGYYAAGIGGAVMGWLAMITPAVIIIPLIHFAGRRAEHPRIKSVLRAVVLSSAGLLWSATIPMARESIHDPLTILIFTGSVGVLLTRKVDSLWVILAAALVHFSVASIRLAGIH